MQISESFDEEDSKYSKEKNSTRVSFLETPFGLVAAQIIENINKAMFEIQFKLKDQTTKTINGFLLKIPAEGNLEIEGLLTNHMRISPKECNEALDCSIKCFSDEKIITLSLALGSCEYTFISEELDISFYQLPQANIEVLRKAGMQWLSVKSQVEIGEQIFVIQEPEKASSYGTNVVYGKVREMLKNEQCHWFLGDMVGSKQSSAGSPVVTFDGRLVGLSCGVSSEGRVRVTHAKSILDAILADFNQIDLCSTPQRTSRKRKLPEVNTDQQGKYRCSLFPCSIIIFALHVKSVCLCACVCVDHIYGIHRLRSNDQSSVISTKCSSSSNFMWRARRCVSQTPVHLSLLPQFHGTCNNMISVLVSF